MPATKLIPVILIGGLIFATGLFFFVPGTRPAIVDKWFRQARGFSNATSAEDALDKLRKAIANRDYDAAKEYLTGDYRELFDKGRENARNLATAIDELRDVMKTTKISSDKVDLWLYWLDPFPAFKYKVKNVSEGATLAEINWNDDAGRFRSVAGADIGFLGNENAGMLHSLLPVPDAVPAPLVVKVKETDGVWKIEFPVQSTVRHVRDGVQALEKKSGNFSVGIRSTKNKLKTDPDTKSDLERDLQNRLSESK